jgi:hypothetical protein
VYRDNRSDRDACRYRNGNRGRDTCTAFALRALARCSPLTCEHS